MYMYVQYQMGKSNLIIKKNLSAWKRNHRENKFLKISGIDWKHKSSLVFSALASQNFHLLF